MPKAKRCPQCRPSGHHIPSSCGDCGTEYFILFGRQDSEDAMSAISCVLRSDAHSDSPNFRKSLNRIMKSLQKQTWGKREKTVSPAITGPTVLLVAIGGTGVSKGIRPKSIHRRATQELSVKSSKTLGSGNGAEAQGNS